MNLNDVKVKRNYHTFFQRFNSMVKAYHEKEWSELQFFSWMIVTLLSSDDLVTRDIDMDAENENWSWTSRDKLHRACSIDQIECWGDSDMKYIPLDPPLEFRDDPIEAFIEKFAVNFISKLISEAFMMSCKITWSIPCSQVCHMSDSLPLHNSVLWNGLRLCWTPELFPSLSTSPNCSTTISSSNIDVSDNSKRLNSHEISTAKQIPDMYNVPFDSDIYAVPVDIVRNPKSAKEEKTSSAKRGRYCHMSDSVSDHYMLSVATSKGGNSSQTIKEFNTEGRRTVNGLIRKPRFSSTTSCSAKEPIHVTVDDVRQYLKTLYANSNEEVENKNLQETLKNLKNPFKSIQVHNGGDENKLKGLKNRHDGTVVAKSEKSKENGSPASAADQQIRPECKGGGMRKWSICRPNFPANFKETLCNIFRIGKLASHQRCSARREIRGSCDEIGIRLSGHEDRNPPSPITKPPFSKRALPPLPPRLADGSHGEVTVADSTPSPSPEEVPPPAVPFQPSQLPVSVDFASSIEKVKDCGWYWGPISGEAAEKILSNEPDGSFIVRDSSDDYYIFSLTFKLNSIIRHVRIEHDQGNFSFGSSTRFKSHTIVDFIESAVEHSRSGRYLFFLHRRPVLGPMRVQLLHPVSRFKQVQSLQHMCRFVILKLVRKDLIRCLPLPRRILDYLSTQHYYSENLTGEDMSDSSSTRGYQPFDREGFS